MSGPNCDWFKRIKPELGVLKRLSKNTDQKKFRLSVLKYASKSLCDKNKKSRTFYCCPLEKPTNTTEDWCHLFDSKELTTKKKDDPAVWVSCVGLNVLED